jgi:hypothetical protein
MLNAGQKTNVVHPGARMYRSMTVFDGPFEYYITENRESMATSICANQSCLA